jgi:hypothetical protein
MISLLVFSLPLLFSLSYKDPAQSRELSPWPRNGTKRTLVTGHDRLGLLRVRYGH